MCLKVILWSFRALFWNSNNRFWGVPAARGCPVKLTVWILPPPFKLFMYSPWHMGAFSTSPLHFRNLRLHDHFRIMISTSTKFWQMQQNALPSLEVAFQPHCLRWEICCHWRSKKVRVMYKGRATVVLTGQITALQKTQHFRYQKRWDYASCLWLDRGQVHPSRLLNVISCFSCVHEVENGPYQQ